MIKRLRAAGRDSEVITWVDRAVNDGRVSGRAGGQGNDYYWLAPTEVTEIYFDAGRGSDAIEVLRSEFSRRAGWATFSQMIEHAARLAAARTSARGRWLRRGDWPPLRTGTVRPWWRSP